MLLNGFYKLNQILIIQNLPEKFAPCHSASGRYVNITLRNITVNNPKNYPGVIFGNSTTPIDNLVFDNVIFSNLTKGKDDYYKCENVGNSVAMGNTKPIPKCFKDMTILSRNLT